MEQLKKLRIKKNMTMKQVGIEAGIAESTYSLIESGKRRPSPEVAQKLGEFLGFDWTEFYVNGNTDKEATENDTARAGGFAG